MDKPSRDLVVVAGGLCRLEAEFVPGSAKGAFPNSFASEQGRFVVQAILDRWPSSNCEYYKIQTTKDSVLLIKHDENKKIWEIVKWFE